MAQLDASTRREIASASVDNADELNDEPLPSTSELASMDLDEMQALLESYGVKLDMERLEQEVRAAVGSDALLIERGAAIDPARWDALNARARRAIASAARSITNQTIGDMRQSLMNESDTRPDDERWQMWVTASGESGCPDCKDRHGIIGRPDFWEGNAPRDGMTVCGGNCKCSLVPCGAPRDETDGAMAS